MRRIPEPELMDTEEQAGAYSAADFAEAHDRLVTLVADRFGPITGAVLDLGCGPADPTVRFAMANPAAHITGIDAGVNMLRLARARVEAAGLGARITLELRHLPDSDLLLRSFDAVISNSLLHHLADPAPLWQTVARCATPGAPVAVMDLARPPDIETLEDLVERHAGAAPPVLRDDFRNSLAAAYTATEIAGQLDAGGLSHFTVETLSDRHLIVSGRR